MGYTRYWNRTEKQITPEFVEFVNSVIEDCRNKGITIKNGLGEDMPIVSTDGIYLNGDASRRLEHETLYFTNDERNRGFNFCKTARKPYDYAVRTILKEAERIGLIDEVASDGENERIISDNEYDGCWL